ncbi:MAG: hypothetical protein RL499_82 [Actinomycetota bacterium]|jgi:uncharacterized protein with FMN-binding domain
MTRMMTGSTRTTVARIAAPLGATAALLGTLTGCSTAATPTEPAAEPVDASYRDGAYQANGPYQSPNGAENIIVAIELENDIVTDVDITVNPNNPTTANYQEQFASGIGDLVIGEDIDTLNVTVVAGSSLTSNGFREAITAIKADALVG